MNSEADWAKGAQQFQQLFGDSWGKALQSFQGWILAAPPVPLPALHFLCARQAAGSCSSST
jgi:polyhydroxyalkanoate synthase